MTEIMDEKRIHRKSVIRILDVIKEFFSIAAFLMLVSYAIFLWEDPGRIILIFLPICIILWAINGIKANDLISRIPILNVIAGIMLAVIAIYLGIYFYSDYASLQYERAANNTSTDYVLGAIAVFIIIWATWKTTGSAIPIVVIFFLVYAAFGNYFPYMLNHTGLSLNRILMISVLDLDGIFGSLPTLGFTTVIVFLYFAGMIQSFGGMEYITEFALILLRKFKWGLPQVSVVTSMFFGMFSGSASANVAADGVFNIPLMKGFGIKPETAGAIETVASVGGQLMPPVMGVAAFIMADFLKVSYAQIVLMAIAPALLYYAFVSFSIFIRTRKLISNLTLDTHTKLENKTHVFRWLDGIPILFSIIALMYLMEIVQLNVLISGILMVITFLIIRFILDVVVYRKRPNSNIRLYPRKILGGVLDGTSTIVDIMLLLAIMGIISRILVATGLAQKISFLMVDLAGGNLWVLLFLIFVASVLFGMAVSTVVAYLLVVMLAAPALTNFGIPLAVSHFIIFYLSLLSHITPPVAMSAAVAANIAGAPFLKTCWESMKLALPLFILPFLFIREPDLVLANRNTLQAFIEICMGFMPVAYALQGEFKGLKQNLIRILLFVLCGLAFLSSLVVVKWSALIIGSLLTILLLRNNRFVSSMIR